MSVYLAKIKTYNLALLCLLWLAFMVYLVQEMADTTLTVALIEGSVFSILLLPIAVLASANVLKYYNPTSDRVIFMVAVVLGLSVIVVFADELLVRWALYPWIETPFADAYQGMLLGYAVLINAGAMLYGYLREKLKEEQIIKERQEEAEKLNKEAELLTLRHQLQPHFLFNSLNSINALVNIDQVQARQMVQQLSAFLRGTISADHQSTVPLAEELEQLHRYLAIEKVRFGHRLETSMQIEEGVEKLNVPMLLLQPLMENAIKFGLYGTTEDVQISVDIRRESNYVSIVLTNPYDPDYKVMAGTGFGLKSIKRRLFLLYNRTDLISTQANTGTFAVTLKLPI